jgi:hypothetical protein
MADDIPDEVSTDDLIDQVISKLQYYLETENLADEEEVAKYLTQGLDLISRSSIGGRGERKLRGEKGNEWSYDSTMEQRPTRRDDDGYSQGLLSCIELELQLLIQLKEYKTVEEESIHELNELWQSLKPPGIVPAAGPKRKEAEEAGEDVETVHHMMPEVVMGVVNNKLLPTLMHLSDVLNDDAQANIFKKRRTKLEPHEADTLLRTQSILATADEGGSSWLQNDLIDRILYGEQNGEAADNERHYRDSEEASGDNDSDDSYDFVNVFRGSGAPRKTRGVGGGRSKNALLAECVELQVSLLLRLQTENKMNRGDFRKLNALMKELRERDLI